jgi:hypothetical protein
VTADEVNSLQPEGVARPAVMGCRWWRPMAARRIGAGGGGGFETHRHGSGMRWGKKQGRR